MILSIGFVLIAMAVGLNVHGLMTDHTCSHINEFQNRLFTVRMSLFIWILAAGIGFLYMGLFNI